MSRLDQAFIKAYAKETPDASLISKPLSSGIPALKNSVVALDAGSPQPTNDPYTNGVWYRTDSQIAHTFEPHANFSQSNVSSNLSLPAEPVSSVLETVNQVTVEQSPKPDTNSNQLLEAAAKEAAERDAVAEKEKAAKEAAAALEAAAWEQAAKKAAEREVAAALEATAKEAAAKEQAAMEAAEREAAAALETAAKEAAEREAAAALETAAKEAAEREAAAALETAAKEEAAALEAAAREQAAAKEAAERETAAKEEAATADILPFDTQAEKTVEETSQTDESEETIESPQGQQKIADLPQESEASEEPALEEQSQAENEALEDDQPLRKATPNTKPKRSFQAAWEVKNFQWPTICYQLWKDHETIFSSATEQLLTIAEAGRNVFGITGLAPGEGRTTLSLCLGRCAAETGASVVLIDADTEHPELSSQLGLKHLLGWSEVESSLLKETAVASLEDGMTLIPLTRDQANDLEDQHRLSDILRQAARLYDVVLVDFGALYHDETVAQISDRFRAVDVAIVVNDLRQRDIEKGEDQQIETVVSELNEAGLRGVMVAETFAPASTPAAAHSKAA